MSKLKILHNYIRGRKTNFFIIYWNVSETQTNANYFCVFFCICSFIDISLNGMLIDKEVYYIFYYLKTRGGVRYVFRSVKNTQP